MADILNSLYTSVFGMSVVFVALVSLIILINIQSIVTSMIANRLEKQTVSDKPAAPVSIRSDLSSHVIDPQELKLTGVDEKTAAIIMAIVCDETGLPPNELYFKSIKLLEKTAPGKNEGE